MAGKYKIVPVSKGFQIYELTNCGCGWFYKPLPKIYADRGSALQLIQENKEKQRKIKKGEIFCD